MEIDKKKYGAGQQLKSSVLPLAAVVAVAAAAAAEASRAAFLTVHSWKGQEKRRRGRSLINEKVFRKISFHDGSRG